MDDVRGGAHRLIAVERIFRRYHFTPAELAAGFHGHQENEATIDAAEAGFERLAKRQPEQPQDDLADRHWRSGSGERACGSRKSHLRRTIPRRGDALQRLLPS